MPLRVLLLVLLLVLMMLVGGRRRCYKRRVQAKKHALIRFLGQETLLVARKYRATAQSLEMEEMVRLPPTPWRRRSVGRPARPARQTARAADGPRGRRPARLTARAADGPRG